MEIRALNATFCRPIVERQRAMGTGSQPKMVEKNGPSSNVGWRFAASIVLIVGGYIAWTFIPVVVATDLSTGAKSVLTTLLGATPFMTKIVAVAIMGKPAYDLFKRTVLKSLRISASPQPNFKNQFSILSCRGLAQL